MSKWRLSSLKLSTCQGQNFFILAYSMPTLGPTTTPWQHIESFLIGKIHLFPKLTATNKLLFVLLIMNLLDVMYCNFAHSLHYIQDMNISQDGNSPIALFKCYFFLKCYFANTITLFIHPWKYISKCSMLLYYEIITPISVDLHCITVTCTKIHKICNSML